MKVIQIGKPFAGMEVVCCQCKKPIALNDFGGPIRCFILPAPGVTPLQVSLLICHDQCFHAAQKEFESRGNRQYLFAEIGIVEGSLEDPQYPTIDDLKAKDDLTDEDYE